MKEAANICNDQGIRLAVENLNPRLTYLFQMPEDFVRMTGEINNLYICVDIGHLFNESVSVLVKKSSTNLIVEAVSDPMKNLELLNSMV